VDGARAYRLPFDHVYGHGGLAVVSEYVGFSAAAAVQIARLNIRRRYDIIQVHNPPDFLAIAAIVPKLRGARVLFDVHDLAPDMFNMRFQGRPGSELAERILRRVERLVARWSDAVLTVHEPYKNELGERGIDRDKITVLLNSVPEELLPASAARSGDEFRVVYHGTLTPHYGVGMLVNAVAHAVPDISGVVLDVYGEGDMLPEMRRRVDELHLGERVRFHPLLPQRDVLAAVAGASVGVVPNLPVRLNKFALSTKLFEYVALGIPVVSSDLPTIRQHFTGEEVRYFEPGNPEALASALVEVFRDPDAASSRAAAARSRYEEYRWPIQAGRYQRLLGELIRR
jgi:glycosyltransferase involved in cell wall biosynthesis